ncbi:MAG: alpha/beta hydrolase family protein [Neisseriaceae bacterium]
MFKLLDSELYNAQFVRAIGNTAYNAAEISECLTVRDKLEAHNAELWYESWFKQATKNLNYAIDAKRNGLKETAYLNFLRASTYFRSSFFFLEDQPNDKRIEDALDKSINSFQETIQLMNYEVKIINIPFRDMLLPAYLYLSSDQKKPLIITCSGGDGTKEESFSCASEALSHGYHCITFEGPGQGSVLRKHKIPFVPDWENVVGAVIDYILHYPQVDANNLIYYGKSFGGFLGARAVAYEKRIKACILDPGQFNSNTMIEQISQKLEKVQSISEYIQKQVNENPKSDFAFKINSRLWRFGADSIDKFLQVIPLYKLEDRVKNINCKMLILDNEEEYLTKGQAKLLYDKLSCQKEYYLFSANENTGGHCQPLAPKITFSYIFDWLNKVL